MAGSESLCKTGNAPLPENKAYDDDREEAIEEEKARVAGMHTRIDRKDFI